MAIIEAACGARLAPAISGEKRRVDVSHAAWDQCGGPSLYVIESIHHPAAVLVHSSGGCRASGEPGPSEQSTPFVRWRVWQAGIGRPEIEPVCPPLSAKHRAWTEIHVDVCASKPPCLALHRCLAAQEKQNIKQWASGDNLFNPAGPGSIVHTWSLAQKGAAALARSILTARPSPT
jgi:hypothetical protein